MRTRATAPKVLVRGRRWAHSRSFSKRVPFLLQRVLVRVGPAVDHHLLGVQFGGLPLSLRRLHLSLDRHAAAGGQAFDLGFVIVSR